MSFTFQELLDSHFVEKPSEEFFCPVTLEVLREPYLTVCCGNHLSQEAADQLRGNQKPCPLCKQPLQAVPDKFFKRKVKELKVRCPNNNAGCGWVGELGRLDQHLNNGLVVGECRCVVVACPNLCGRRIQRRDLERHKTNDCPNRQFACTHCAFRATYQEITEDHWPYCRRDPLECPNNCGERGIERQDLPNHLEVCPLQIIDCEFDYAGCKKRVQRQEMQFHVDSSVKAHLQMVATHAKKQEKQIEALIAQFHQLMTLQQQTKSPVFIPPPIFIMTSFEQHKKNDDIWLSPPFYSYIRGYKMCISVYANGCGAGEGTHLSVYLNMMRGEYDDNLEWPFRGEVTVQLLNQRNDVNHCEGALIERGDYSSDDIDFMVCVARVQEAQQHGPEWGYHEFIPHRRLGYNAGKDCQYLMNDCLKFQVNKVVTFDI